MRKTLINNKDELSDFIFDAIVDGMARGKQIDGYYLSGCTSELRKSLYMTSVEVCYFVKTIMKDISFDNKVVSIERKNGNNGHNIYKVVDINAFENT